MFLEAFVVLGVHLRDTRTHHFRKASEEVTQDRTWAKIIGPILRRFASRLRKKTPDLLEATQPMIKKKKFTRFEDEQQYRSESRNEGSSVSVSVVDLTNQSKPTRL